MKKMIIFGAGSASLNPIFGVNTDNYEIVAVVDNDEKKWGKEWLGYNVQSLDVIKELEYDLIVISHIYGDSATRQLVEMGVDQKKIFNFYGNLDMFYDVRISMLYTCAKELKREKKEGEMAELGVFQGEFSKHMNMLFPEKKLYLFDTFEGFDKKDISEMEKRISNPMDSEFKNTSVELVLEKMRSPQNVIVRKGYFPETCKDIDEKFSLVSLDPDLYLPVLNGLEFFWPRLVKGGYIFVHDYNNRRFSGVKRAVDDFRKKNNIPIFPICDIGGTLIITK